MTKSSKSSSTARPPIRNHGGKRPGAGRKPRAYASPTALSLVDRQALLAGIPLECIEPAAQLHALACVAALAKCLEFGSGEAARVAAAKSILDRGYGRLAVETGGDTAQLPGQPGLDAARVGAEVRAEARKYALLAIEVLRRIAEFATSESASVSASSALLNRGLGTVVPSRVPDQTRPRGKREQAAENAQSAAIGTFETPAPPGKAPLQ